ncbi:hybrid sensor histidine kinase/response regulator [Pseudomonas gozinkensis]|uniref:hybrid sensor histidine kinase/response regulator n=1 Tax=Pseudomonas gozinkensis TaxID=2774461 RepID=UPI0017885B4D|nr:hybrid sensor histidine kinase/response regulator [Pseudomonas gozinkensis]
MNHPNALLEKLASSSLRLNKGFIVLGALVLILIGISYLGIQRTLEEQRDTMGFHFARLMENIREQEAFLKAVQRYSAKGPVLDARVSPLFQQKNLPDQGPDVYEGRQFSFSMPFSVKIASDKIAVGEQPKVFALAAHLSDYYSAFWSASHYQSPQVFLFNVPDNFDITVPATGHIRRDGQIQGGIFGDVVAQVRKQLHDQSLDNQVHWNLYSAATDDVMAPTLVAYINIDLASSTLNIQGASPRVALATLLNLSQVNNIERIMQWSIYDQFTLISPSGKVLVGAFDPQRMLQDGTNFNRDGLVFKLTSHDEHPWTAIYTISFKSFLDYALWPLLCLAALVLTGLGCGWAFNRWYKSRVVLPAHQAHLSIAESEAFNRAVIDTAPAGLYVVRCSDHKVLLENQRAQQWQDTTQVISALSQQHGLTEPGQAELEVDGRHLHVAFVSTRYQGQDAWLCVFHDVTRHIEDAAALEEARRAADSANEAKTLFLATMSHEIRTPLYGVLGTLELLGLTELEPRQQAYLHTIQRSSATLFQLISDVLDVSKIESGQMIIESQEFCPLELTEDTLRTYSAFAQTKGLQLYACIDATLPNRVRGDPQRIRQILNNLLSNAIKFTDYGRVVLRVRVLQTDGSHVSLQWQVSDTGSGISQTQQAQLFNPFYQVRDGVNGSGAGLGLAICRWLCELMAGQLKVVSEPGLGSSFSLQLSLENVPGELADCPEFKPGASAVYVRAPVQELTHHLCAWLNRLGIEARSLSPDLLHAEPSTLLVDMLPSGNELPWLGASIIATADGHNPPEYLGSGWNVDAYDVRAIAWSIYLADQGVDESDRQVLPGKSRSLNLHILVAEDNPINSQIIKEQLEALGCSVVLAGNGEQALAQWSPGLFDLVLSDINMPIMNGYEFAATLRQHDVNLPIIGVTANALREEGERCAAVGMNAWMVKPLNLKTLRTKLLECCVKPVSPNASVADDSLAHEVPADSVQLSPKMRELFICTMKQDRQTTLAALDSGDSNTVARQLHSMAGALGAVQAGSMAIAFAELESRLMAGSITPTLILEVNTQLDRLNALLNSLE